MKIVKIYIGLNVIITVFLCIVVIFSGCTKNSALITQKSGDPVLAKLLESVRIESGLPALSAAVILDGKIIATAAVGTRKYGTANWITVSDKFMIGSCGKAFTATLAAILIEKGRLSWKTTILEAFPKLEMLPEFENITMQQLLSHRAGLSKNFIADLDEKRPFTPESGRLQYIEQIVQTTLINPPDKVMLYSNAGYTLAGAIMEKITGQTFENLMAEEVFRPLHLTTAGYVSPALSEPKSQPWGHIRKNWSLTAIKKDYNYWLNPAGSTLSMSVRDWAKFVSKHMYMNQDKSRTLINSVSLKNIHTPPNDAKWDYDEKYLEMWFQIIGWPLTSANYATGWYTVKTKEGTSVLYHGGATKSFIADVYASPKDKTAILLATNVRTKHTPLYECAEKIKEYYSLKINLP